MQAMLRFIGSPKHRRCAIRSGAGYMIPRMGPKVLLLKLQAKSLALHIFEAIIDHLRQVLADFWMTFLSIPPPVGQVPQKH